MFHPSVMHQPSLPAAPQRGVVLVVALIFLLLLTILAISASGRSLLQERMAGGLRNAQLAEQSARDRAARRRVAAVDQHHQPHRHAAGLRQRHLTGGCYRYEPSQCHDLWLDPAS